MSRSNCSMGSLRSPLSLLATLCLVAYTSAGPLGPLPMHNLTAADMGLKEESCALGDVVYMAGDEFPGSSPCERCRCRGGGVRCSTQACEPRPGCKALHRPDHCCPLYQCECEQEGRVYGNGEKLVDPLDPCRVCYCQGGEVVCRRIACFQRDDCTPRRVPGRCCPEYDNCPLRGVTSMPDLTSLATSPAPSAASLPPAPASPAAPAITIKEITPKSEIPIITEVKIKEILPSPSIEVAEYSSSKSPLIPREATSQKSNTDETFKPEQEMPSVVEVHSFPEAVASDHAQSATDGATARAPSKISLSTQDSINSEIYPTIPIVATMGVPISIETLSASSSTKAPALDEEDPSLFDHNPAFPPLPDDLSNHGEEIVQEPSIDADHIPVQHSSEPQVNPLSITASAETSTTTHKNVPDSETTVKPPITETSTVTEPASTVASTLRETPIIKLRSAIPSDSFSVSSEETINKITSTENSREITTQTSTARPTELTTVFSTTTTEATTKMDRTETTTPFITTLAYEETTKSAEITKYDDIINSEEYGKSQEILKSEEINVGESSKSEESTTILDVATTPGLVLPIERVSFINPESESDASAAESQISTQKVLDSVTTGETTPSTPQEQSTNYIAKSNIATEVTSQTELLSSLPIETSDQNPHESSLSEAVSKDSLDGVSTPAAQTEPSATTLKPTSSETLASSSEVRSFENVETTEFIISNFGSSETSTDAVEIIKIPGDAGQNAAIIDRGESTNNALTDFISLVKDVASMSDHVEPAATTQHSPVDSEELLPISAGYKSKNSNANQNSITEIPFKSKSATVNKQKVIEIEDDEESSITDSPPPNDRAEPTTRRAIIDNVSDDLPAAHHSGTNKKDIEIITQSYVPTINRRPTKVILEETEPEQTQGGASAETTTAAPTPNSAETTTPPVSETTTLASTPAAATTTSAPPTATTTTTLAPPTTAEITTPPAATTLAPGAGETTTPAPAAAESTTPSADQHTDSDSV